MTKRRSQSKGKKAPSSYTRNNKQPYNYKEMYNKYPHPRPKERK